MFEYNLGAIHLLWLVVSDGAELELPVHGSIEYVDLPSTVTPFFILWFIAMKSFGYNGFATWFVLSLSCTVHVIGWFSGPYILKYRLAWLCQVCFPAQCNFQEI